MPKPILCPCGTEKFEMNGAVLCLHCDTGCRAAAASQQCQRCATYSLNTTSRVMDEHAAERALKRRNGC